MKTWLQNDQVYQSIMNGALWIVFSAALITNKWPQFDWITGSIMVIMVAIVVSVYWISVVKNDKEQRISIQQHKENNKMQENSSYSDDVHEKFHGENLEEIYKNLDEIYKIYLGDNKSENIFYDKKSIDSKFEKKFNKMIYVNEEDKYGRLIVNAGSFKIKIKKQDDRESNFEIKRRMVYTKFGLKTSSASLNETTIH